MKRLGGRWGEVMMGMEGMVAYLGNKLGGGIGNAGGEATGAVSGFEGLINDITHGGNYSNESPGAPIAYKLA